MKSNIYNRVALWNSRRYDREYNPELCLDLLTEEWIEYVQADNLVDRLDGLCDVAYVALGGVWKLNLAEADMDKAADLASEHVLLSLQAGAKADAVFKAISWYVASDDDLTAMFGCHCMSALAFYEAQVHGFTPDQFNRAMLAVCDSNDSKSAKKTAANVKANTSDKGEFYKSPTAALTKIVEEMQCQSAKH